MTMWHSWLGYLGLIGGLGASALLGVSPLRTALLGFAVGIAAVVVINFVHPRPAPCLQSAKGFDILRAYSLECGR